jgi:hypothetical protein
LEDAEMTDIYSLILQELKNAKVCHVDRFAPFFIFSIGSHIFNLRNKVDKEQHVIYREKRFVPDTRLHIMFVAPQGGEKSFWLSQFLRGREALLVGSGIGFAMKGSMTEAGFVGSFHLVGGEYVEKKGICKTHASSIVGIEEFSAVISSMSMEHSQTLDTAYLNALDHGWVYKDLGSGNLDYQTFITLWCATQHARFDLRQGMARRFMFINNVPSEKDRRDITLARREAKCSDYNSVPTNKIREEIKKLKTRVFNEIERVEFDQNVYKFYDILKLSAWEERMYDSMIMGYKIMRGNFDKVLYVDIDETIKHYILQEAKHRDSIGRGSEFAEILLVIREHGGEMDEFELKEALVPYGKDWSQSSTAIGKLISLHGLIRDRSTGRIKLSPSLRGKKL